MKIEHLKVLQAVVETGTVGGASHHLGKTQPAISQALRAMETLMGAKLFDRSGYRLVLTPLGRRVYLQSLRVLSEADDLNQMVRQFEAGNEEKLVVAIDDTVDLDPLLPAFRSLQSEFPECRIMLRTCNLSGATRLLQTEEANLAIGPTPLVLLEDTGFEYFPLSQACMRNVASPALISSMRGIEKITDLRRFHQVLVRDSGGAVGMFDREFGVQKGQRRWYADDLETKKTLLLAGLGWGRMPDHLVATDLENQRLQELHVAFTHLPLTLDYHVFRAPNSSIGPVALFLWQALEALVTPSMTARAP
ncbi:MAG: LysR family transcriptional regulator [Thalassovita sp.]